LGSASDDVLEGKLLINETLGEKRPLLPSDNFELKQKWTAIGLRWCKLSIAWNIVEGGAGE
jgi:hypothetical protein